MHFKLDKSSRLGIFFERDGFNKIAIDLGYTAKSYELLRAFYFQMRISKELAALSTNKVMYQDRKPTTDII